MKRPPAVPKSNGERKKNIVEGRKAFQKRQWTLAFSKLSAADQQKPLDTADLEYLSKTAFILGKEAVGSQILIRAHQEFLGRGETLPASRCAFWLGFTMLLNGESARAGGWLSRADRLLGNDDCVEKGYLLFADGFRSVQEQNFAEAYDLFTRAAAAADRFHEKDLMTLSLNGQGRALIAQGEITRGVVLLDEAMVAVTSDEVSTLVAGGVYCSVIEACTNIFDLRRAQEWTSALEDWCSTQSDQISYRGHCMLRRAEILQLHGAWDEALKETKRAIERLSESSNNRAQGAAFYQLGDIHRLRGEFEKAEEAYRTASHLGSAPQPGFSLLQLTQGQLDAACASIRRLAAESRNLNFRASVLETSVEIMLQAKEIAAARTAAVELQQLASHFNARLLDAMSLRAMGAVLLAEENISESLSLLSRSLNIWNELDAPYDAARVKFLMALACKKDGDCDSAELELDSAQQIFEKLGALPDLAQIQKCRNQDSSKTSDLLTAREMQVLKLLASGTTNRHIANKLNISEKTVARHVSNIFMKLDLSTRAAATAYAYQHHLL